MNILVINCGSSSLKFQLIDSASEEVLAKGLCERIGIDGRLVYQSEGNEKEITKEHMPTHTEAVKLVLEALVNPKTGAISSLDEIGAVGHRIVHGGEAFTESTLITDEVIAAVERVSELAPLHNPANLIGIEACQTIFVAKHPVTKPSLKHIKKSECRLEEKIDELMQTAIDTTETILVDAE